MTTDPKSALGGDEGSQSRSEPQKDSPMSNQAENGLPGEAVAWHKMTDRQPELGCKFVALYDDGSGAWLGFAHDGGVIDADGDDYSRMPKAEWWAYLPSGFRLVCEDYPEEAYTLPDHVCPPLIPASDLEQVSRDLGEAVRLLREIAALDSRPHKAGAPYDMARAFLTNLDNPNG